MVGIREPIRQFEQTFGPEFTYNDLFGGIYRISFLPVLKTVNPFASVSVFTRSNNKNVCIFVHDLNDYLLYTYL